MSGWAQRYAEQREDEADELVELREENARLRKALEEIRDDKLTSYWIQGRCSKALEGGK